MLTNIAKSINCTYIDGKRDNFPQFHEGQTHRENEIGVAQKKIKGSLLLSVGLTQS